MKKQAEIKVSERLFFSLSPDEDCPLVIIVHWAQHSLCWLKYGQAV